MVSQFNLKVVNQCESSIVTHSNFPDITYYAGSASTATTYSPVFTGADNTVCTQAVVLYLRMDGQGDNWVTWAGGSFTIGTTTYTFISSLVTTGAIGDLGEFVIDTTSQATFRPGLKFNARIVLSNQANGKTDTLDFNISMKDVCEVNELTQSSTQPNVVHTILPASTLTNDDSINWTFLTQNTIANYNGGAPAGISCPITRELYI